MQHSTVQQKMAEGISQYHQPKPLGDIDLVTEVRELLLQAGLHQAVSASFDTNRFVNEAINKPSEVQRFLLNRYWNLQLMSSTKPTTEERFCLIPNGSVQDWLTLFRDKVLPFIIENKLPVTI